MVGLGDKNETAGFSLKVHRLAERAADTNGSPNSMGTIAVEVAWPGHYHRG